MNCKTIFISSVTTTDTGVILIPSKTIKNLINTGNYRLIVACNVEATSNLPLFIQTSAGNIPVLCKYGNELLANQINKRVNYPIGYGNQNTNYTNGQFVVLSCNCLNARGTESTTTEVTGDDINPNTRKK
jgi:hypothetical protein